MGYRMIDTHNVGRVSLENMEKKLRKKEIQNYIQVIAERIEEVVEAIDADGDGWVTWAEFRDHLSNKRVADVFQNMDVDGDGVISSDEFRKFYLGADTDGDGKVSDREMAEFIQRTKPQSLLNPNNP